MSYVQQYDRPAKPGYHRAHSADSRHGRGRERTMRISATGEKEAVIVTVIRASDELHVMEPNTLMEKNAMRR